MDTISSGSRKRKGCFYDDFDSGATSHDGDSAVGTVHGQFRTLSASPKRLATHSRGSDISCQSQLMCGEWLDNMSLDSILACSTSADMSSSGSPSSFLSVTTAGTSKPQLSDEGASELCESLRDPEDSSSNCCCCELSAEPPSCTCFGTRLFAFSEDSLVRSMAAMYGFSPQCTSVGTSYFARLAARDARLMATAKAHSDFAPLVEGVCIDPEPTALPLAQQLRQLTNPKQWLMALHLCCNYLAAKNIDKVMYRNLLTLILSHAHGEKLPSRVAASLEIELLEALRWRLGPFFHCAPRCSPPPLSTSSASSAPAVSDSSA